MDGRFDFPFDEIFAPTQCGMRNPLGLNLITRLKVSYFQNVFLVSSILPKNEQNIRLYYYGTLE
jgi:hypothetical protein